ncbi:MAG: hypothetical protein GX776_03545 [Oxalobacter sp.]|nr:hypothetical protein [Oxalobacter sp.]
MQCFVINLPKDTDRKQSISEELQKAGIEFSIIEAVNGAELVQMAPLRIFTMKRKPFGSATAK